MKRMKEELSIGPSFRGLFLLGNHASLINEFLVSQVRRAKNTLGHEYRSGWRKAQNHKQRPLALGRVPFKTLKILPLLRSIFQLQTFTADARPKPNLLLGFAAWPTLRPSLQPHRLSFASMS
jgi:hypothetical protein